MLAELLMVAGLQGSASACANGAAVSGVFRQGFNSIMCTEVDRALNEAAVEFKVDGNRIRRMATCESGLDPFAGRKYKGLFQQSNVYWNGRVRAFNRDNDIDVTGNIYSPFDNARVTAYMISKFGYGAWPSCGRG